MKYSETEANNETQSITNTKAYCSNLNISIMHKQQYTEINWYLHFIRLLLKAHVVGEKFTTPILKDYLQLTVNVNYDVIHINKTFDCFNSFCKDLISVFC